MVGLRKALYLLFACGTYLMLMANAQREAMRGGDGFVCRRGAYRFPTEAFDYAPDTTKVYLEVNRIAPSLLREAGLVKYVRVFGIAVVADEECPDKKLIHVGRTLAELLDVDESGVPNNKLLVHSLNNSHSLIAVIQNRWLFKKLLVRSNRPRQLKCFSRAFHVVPATAVRTQGGTEVNCPADSNNKDRTKGLVGDFIVSKGYPATYSLNDRTGQMMSQYFYKAKSEGWINAMASNCKKEECLEIAFQSWALSSALGSDKCWCLAAREWSFCDPEAMRAGFPELWATFATELDNNGRMQPDGVYYSKALVA